MEGPFLGRLSEVRSCCRLWAWFVSVVARLLQCWVICSSSSRVFLCLLQGGGIGDPLTPLCTRKGIDDEMGGAHKTFFHRGRRLDGAALIHQRLVEAAQTLTQRLGEDKVSL